MKKIRLYTVILVVVGMLIVVIGIGLYKNDNGQVKIITNTETVDKVISLNLVGLSTPNTNMKTVELFKQYQQKATFFVPGSLVQENKALLRIIAREGHGVGSNGYIGTSKMELKTQPELIDLFTKTNQNIKQVIKRQKSILLYCNGTQYTKELLEAAYISGNKQVVESSYVVNYRSFSSYEQTLEYIRKLPRGAILMIKMDGELDAVEYQEKNQNDRPAEDKQADLMDTPVTQLEEEERLLLVIEWILKALEEDDYETILCEKLPKMQERSAGQLTTIEEADRQRVEALREANKGSKATILQKIYTVEPVVGYTFYGVSEKESLEGVLAELKEEQIKATFFISAQEIERAGEQIAQIVQDGHELQMMLLEEDGESYFEIARTILKIKDYIKEHFNQDAEYVRYPYDISYTDNMLEAISATGCKVIGQNLTTSLSQLGKEATADEVMQTIFHAGNTTLSRGYNVYFRMDYYKDTTIVPELIKRIKLEKVDDIAVIDNGMDGYHYTFATLSELMQGQTVYQYPVAKEDMLPEVIGVGGATYLEDMPDRESFIIERYIGNPYAQSEQSLPGFTEDEIARLDKTGRFTQDKVIFLTFDDWGSDVAINQLLYVLDKYNVKASFFVRTNYIHDNPNLLRAIALAGHDIASHTHQHLVLANMTDKKGVYEQLTLEEASVLKEDLITSYKELQSVVGDIWVDGRPALQKYFRPPTLAVSKRGLEVVLDAGFSYSVAGDFSTHDYEAKSAEEIVEKFKGAIQNGSIVVMHMSDEAQFTAEALDILIPYYLEQGYTFARIGDYLVDKE